MFFVKRLFISLLITYLCIPVFAQEVEKKVDSFRFTTVKEVPITSVKNQSSTGTCWCFSGLGLIEAELLRMGKGEFDLSEMFIVHKNYEDKARKYIRMHGEINFSEGGAFSDVLEAIKDYGIVPEELQPGLNYGDTVHRHGELASVLQAYVNAILKNQNKKLSTAWHKGFTGVVDAYLGACPETFTYNGKQYTPASFAQYLGVHPDDYVSITSFTHHPFYTSFPLEIPDNWRWTSSYNVPLNEMMQIIDTAIDKGYSVGWASDVSEKGFNRKGIAVVPNVDAKEGPGSDQAHWLGLTQADRDSLLTNLTAPVPEKNITQAMRQEGFDNYETTDDHGMLIYGIAEDQNGSNYYMVKNSWGTNNPYKGVWYASVPFVQYKTISIVVHKDVLSKELKNKLGIK
jgi:aminopeptidase C